MLKYKYLLFDLDGTITDSFDSVVNSFIHALSCFGVNVTDKSILRPVLGPPLKDSFMNLFGFDEEKAEKAVEKYRERYAIYNTVENRLYDGMDIVLHKLCKMGYKLVLATSKPEEYAVKILKHFNIYECFYDVCGASFDESRSEKEDVLKHLLKKNNIRNMKDVVMIGDRKYDLGAAHTLGMDAIGVLYGYGDYAELSSYPNVYLADTPELLYNYFVCRAGDSNEQ